MSKNILLDTHILLWLVDGNEALRAKDKDSIDKLCSEGGTLFISTISIWEVALLTSKNRISLGNSVEDWLKVIISTSYFEIVPISPEIAIKSCYLSKDFHSDPADRIIVATSILLGAPLLTYDDKILKYAEKDFTLVL